MHLHALGQQAFPTPGTAAGEDRTAVLRFHPRAKTKLTFPGPLGSLIGAFHKALDVLKFQIPRGSTGSPPASNRKKQGRKSNRTARPVNTGAEQPDLFAARRPPHRPQGSCNCHRDGREFRDSVGLVPILGRAFRLRGRVARQRVLLTAHHENHRKNNPHANQHSHTLHKPGPYALHTPLANRLLQPPPRQPDPENSVQSCSSIQYLPPHVQPH